MLLQAPYSTPKARNLYFWPDQYFGEAHQPYEKVMIRKETTSGIIQANTVGPNSVVDTRTWLLMLLLESDGFDEEIQTHQGRSSNLDSAYCPFICATVNESLPQSLWPCVSVPFQNFLQQVSNGCSLGIQCLNIQGLSFEHVLL